MGLFSSLKKVFFTPTAREKGAKGERMVKAKLNPLIFGKVEHRLLNDIIFVDENGKSHQVDHIEIRQNGIFCIETKNYSGWIFGDATSKQWTQSMPNGSKKQFLNPLVQNRSHVNLVSLILGRRYPVHSIVVMVQDNADKVRALGVVNLSSLKKYLEDYNDGTNLTIEEMDWVYGTLQDASTKMSNRQHVKNIRKTQQEIEQGICPRCGGSLVLRHGSLGDFYGCSNYPKCKFTKNNR